MKDMLWSWARTYAEVNALLGISSLVIFASIRLLRRRLGVDFRMLLRLGYGLALLSIAIPVALRAVPAPSYFKPAAQVWSAPSMKRQDASVVKPAGLQVLSSAPIEMTSGSSQLAYGVACTALLLALAMVARYGRAMFRLRSFCAGQPVVKRLHGVEILVTNETLVPFSARVPGHRYVVVPATYIENPAQYKIAVLHELQHHRQRDTTWLHVLEVMRALCAVNPLAHRLCRDMSELQELACDEALVGRRVVSPQAYGRCLVEAAQSALRGGQGRLVGTASMAARVSGVTLKRRLEMLARSNGTVMKSGLKRRLVELALGTAALATVGGVALAAKDALKDRRVTMKEALALAEQARAESDFPIVVDELVLEQLNRYVGTPDGREYMREALVRKEDYRVMIEGKLSASGLPLELAAIPIVESKYTNLPPAIDSPHSGGVWQFIPQTARRFGLRVDRERDERRNTAKATDAAAAYLTALYGQFQDWGFAVSAYNMGEGRVQAVINETGIRDPWELARRSKLERYLSAVMAAVIIVKNPQILD